MSLNIAPHIPHTLANATAPATESLAHANAVKEVVPAPTQVEAYVPQKSREQDARPPELDNPTYDDIQKQDPKVIPEDQQEEERSSSEQNSQSDSEEQEQNEVSQQAEGRTESGEDEQESAEKKAEKRVEEAEARVELQQIQQLERRDAEVRAHEQAHAAVGGSYAGSPSYEYETGPNGKKYAVGGEVPIDVSVEDTPQETISKMQTVRAAALAPAEPSSQDRKVAAEATQKIAEARSDLINESSSLQQERSKGLNDEEDETNSIQVNTDSPLAHEPRKRSLSGVEAPAKNDDGAEQAKLAKEQDTISRVINQRYAASYQSEQTGFSAVA